MLFETCYEVGFDVLICKVASVYRRYEIFVVSIGYA